MAGSGRITSRRRRFAVLTAALMLVGCGRPQLADTRRAAHVVVLPGIAGADPFNQRLARLIGEECRDTSAEVWNWTALEPNAGLSTLPNLLDFPRNQRRAEVLTAQLVSWRKRHPQSRLSLVGMSGGAGIALFAIDKLPAGFELDRVVLLSAAVAPDYDLSGALRRARRGVFNYYSHMDGEVLDRGTTAAGTMERRFTAAAGCLGFNLPDDPVLAARLHQLAWTPKLLPLENDGRHLGGLALPFVRQYVLPLFEATDRATAVAAWRVVRDDE